MRQELLEFKILNMPQQIYEIDVLTSTYFLLRILPDSDAPMFDTSPLPSSPSHRRQTATTSKKTERTKSVKSPLVHSSKASQTGQLESPTVKRNSSDSVVSQPSLERLTRSKSSPTPPGPSHPPQSPPASVPAPSPLTMESALQSGNVKVPDAAKGYCSGLYYIYYCMRECATRS